MVKGRSDSSYRIASLRAVDDLCGGRWTRKTALIRENTDERNGIKGYRIGSRIELDRRKAVPWMTESIESRGS